MAKWFEIRKGADFNKIGEKYGISPILVRIIRNREITEDNQIEKFFYGTLRDTYDGNLLKDMEKAVSIINENTDIENTSLENNEIILNWIFQ